MEQKVQCTVFVYPSIRTYVIRHCLPGVAFHVNDYVVRGGIASCVRMCVVFLRIATYGISVVVFWWLSIAAYSWLKGTKWFFFNIMYDLTRKQPAMVQHCIDAKRLHTLKRGRYTWCDFPESGIRAHHHWYVKIDDLFEQFKLNGCVHLCNWEHRWNPKFEAI